jgi:hypothetical protein
MTELRQAIWLFNCIRLADFPVEGGWAVHRGSNEVNPASICAPQKTERLAGELHPLKALKR